MAFPTVLGRASSSRGTDATSHDVTLPVTPSSGDLIVIFYATDGSGASNWSTTSSNAGSGSYSWNKPLADENHSGGCNAGVRWRISDGTETSPQRFTTSSSEHFVARAYVIDAGTFNATTPLEAGDDVEGSSTTPDPPSLSPSWGAADTLWIAFYGADDDDESSAAPTNYSNFVCIESAQSTTSCSLGISDRQNNTATEDPGSYTMAATEEWLATTVAIQPASGDISVTLTPVTNTHTAQALAFTKTAISVSLTPATSTDGAQALSSTQAAIQAALTAALETDTAVALSYAVSGGDILVSLTPVSETDAAQPLGFTKQAITLTFTPAAESDAAQALAFTQQAIALSLIAVLEANAAQALSGVTSPPITISITPVVETDAAQGLNFTKAAISVTLTPAAELDSAQDLSYFVEGVAAAISSVVFKFGQGGFYT